jgi:hypothetical protein
MSWTRSWILRWNKPPKEASVTSIDSKQLRKKPKISPPNSLNLFDK